MKDESNLEWMLGSKSLTNTGGIILCIQLYVKTGVVMNPTIGDGLVQASCQGDRMS